MSQNQWQECQALATLLKKTDDEIRQKSENLRALQSRRQLLKNNLNKELLARV